ncbi:hypothetical protein LXL04_014096 [Taraxacum kok-saghyz]
METTDGGWKTVRRRNKDKQHTERPDLTSLYVSNILVGIKISDIWRTFKPFGTVTDVYIPDKKNKQGAFFCFVKFLGIKDPISFEQSLPTLKIRNNTLTVNLSKFPRKTLNQASFRSPLQPPPPPPPTHNMAGRTPVTTTSRDHRSYAGAVTGSIGNTIKEIHLKEAPSMSNWYKCSQNLFGTAASLEHLRDLPSLLKYEGYVYYTGGLNVTMRFEDPDAAK